MTDINQKNSETPTAKAVKLSDLLCCPFCGGEAHITARSRGFRVECKKRFNGCPINMRTHHFPTDIEAVNAWNTRAA